MNALVSVIVPIYNVESYLNQCIKSICLQSYSNLEIILVDDGSTDKCSTICDEWAIKDSRIKVIHKINGGLSDARNVGIDIANGYYLTFIDSDDVITSDMIAYLIDLVSTDGADMSVCQRSTIDESGKLISHDYQEREKKEIIRGKMNCMKSFLTYSYIDTVAWGKLYKTSLFYDIRYPKGKFHEDVFTTYKLIAKCNLIVIGYEQKYLYRIRSGSITQISFSQKHMDAIIGKEEQAEFVMKLFPKLSHIAFGDIIYACNQCVLRLAKSDTSYLPFITELKDRYIKYVKYYLRGNYLIKGRLFALACRLNLSMVINSIKFIEQIKNRLY